jgi:hypothetical protein
MNSAPSGPGPAAAPRGVVRGHVDRGHAPDTGDFMREFSHAGKALRDGARSLGDVGVFGWVHVVDCLDSRDREQRNHTSDRLRPMAATKNVARRPTGGLETEAPGWVGDTGIEPVTFRV